MTPIGYGLAGGRLGLGLAQGAGAAAVPWYRAGGAPEPYWCIQPKGAASQAASYLRIAGSGGYANIDPAVVGGVAPTFNAATGWTFDGASQYLKTGYRLPSATQKSLTLVVRYANATWTLVSMLAGVKQYSSADAFGFWTYFGAYKWSNGGAKNDTLAAAGVVGIAGASAYKDGASLGSITDGTNTMDYLLVLGAANDTLPGLDYNVTWYIAADILAVALYSSVLTGPQVAAVSAAMAAL